MTPLAAVLTALVVARLTRLVTEDTITEPLRSRLIARLYRPSTAVPNRGETWDDFAHRDPRPPKPVTLVICPWCASAWLAGPVAWSAWCFGDRAWWAVPALALAGSLAAGMLSAWED